MRRHPRSENRKIVRKLSDTGEGSGTVAAADIGSRVFPFRSPPASMPSVRARRSTRVFVTKATTAKPLRAAKPQSRSDGDESDWMPLAWWKPEEGKKRSLRAAGVGVGLGLVGWNKPVVALEPEICGVQMFDIVYSRKPPVPVALESKDSLKSRMFDIVYSRKRRRSQSDESASSSSSSSSWDRKYGIVYVRRWLPKKPKLAPVVDPGADEAPVELRLEDREHGDAVARLDISESVRNLAEKVVDISEDVLCTAPDDPLALAVFVEPSSSGPMDRFSTILIPVVNWMRRPRAGLWNFAAILFSESLAAVFSLHGIHFLPLRLLKIDVLSRNALSRSGICKIYNAGHFVPLLSVDYSTLPHYFKNMHVAWALGSLYLPGVLTRYLRDILRSEEDKYSLVPLESVFSRTDDTSSLISVALSHEFPSIVEAPANMAIEHSSSLQRHHKRKRKMRSRVDRNNFSLPASTSSLHNLMEPIRVKPLDACLGDLLREEDDTSSPCGPLKSKKFEGTREMKLALTEVKQNIDSVRCNVNVLVMASDRCWREEGAELMLEFADSKEWCIAVKVQGATRYLHKPQDWRPCAVNRLNHTYMWGWDDGWKLEFFDKWDWSLFKEMHMECRERNTPEVPVKIIPVPGVEEVSDYDEIVTSFFMRPDMYICMMGDEVERVVASEVARYDMDSGDEDWLNQQNSSSLDLEDNGLGHISEDDFEKIIFSLEKDAYGNPNDIPEKEKALDHCQNLGRRDIVAVVYDYWLKKRNKRRTALVKVFQGPPLRRTQLLQKPYLRKKRSFSRQRSQAGRGKPDFYLQAGAKLQAKRRVEEADNAANRAVEAAIRQRSRAQMLMANAEMAVYKSAMALRIADAKRVSEETSHLASVILD